MKTVCGVGINDVPGVTKHPIYWIWHRMHHRCYDPKFHERRPTYRGCSVCHAWHLLSNFWKWAEPRWLPGLQLDKDIRVSGNKCYGPAFCVFVTREVNNLLNDNGRQRGQWPQGVSHQQGRFLTHVRTKRRQIYLGSFDTPEEAHRCYIRAKAAEIRRVAADQDNPLVLVGLEQHAKLLEAGSRYMETIA